MQLPAVLASDLHLTANPADRYRWGLFPWLCDELQAERAQTLVLLGDLTDAKDYHPAELVNAVVDAVNRLRAAVPRVIILMGNHDLLKANQMFFQFLGTLPGVEVISKPTEDSDLVGPPTFFLPYSKTPARDWAGMDFSHYHYLFMHQTVAGSVASNGQTMDGESLPALAASKVYSGDIHVPQTVGPVEYVGSPYHVHFGDKFVPRCIAVDRQRVAHDLHFKCINRVTLDARSIEDLGTKMDALHGGDQVKIRLTLRESDKHAWQRLRREATQMARDACLELHGLDLIVDRRRRRVGATTAAGTPAAHKSPQESLLEFVAADDLGASLLDTGLECLEG